MESTKIEKALALAEATLQEVTSNIDNPRIAELLVHINQEVAGIFEESEDMEQDIKTILLVLIERVAATTNMLQHGMFASGQIVDAIILPKMVQELVGEAITKHKQTVSKIFEEAGAKLNS